MAVSVRLAERRAPARRATGPGWSRRTRSWRHLRARAFSPGDGPGLRVRRGQLRPVPRSSRASAGRGGADGRVRLGGLARRAPPRRRGQVVRSGAAASDRGAGHGQPAGRRGAGVLRVPGDEPGPRRRIRCRRRGAVRGCARRPAGCSVTSGPGRAARRRPAGARAAPAARVASTLADVQAFLAALRTHRDRAMVLAMLLGGLRSAEVRGLRLADVDRGAVGCG